MQYQYRSGTPLLYAVAGAAFVIGLAGCGSTTTSVPATPQAVLHVADAVTPQASVLIGIFANPTQSTGTAMQKIAAVESTIGRKFDVSVHYDTWGQTFPSTGELDDRLNGRIPEVSWECALPDAVVASGAADAIVMRKAQQMAAYGAPILLRYKWEFNLPYHANGRAACFDAARDTNGSFDAPTFIAAWRHVHDVFVAAHARNVAFVWNPTGTGVNPGTAYWPGDAYVDWVGIDQYDTRGRGLSATLAGPYATYAAIGDGTHPLIVGETGAMADQPTFLDGNARATLATQFPRVKAISYFDAAGPNGNWSFSVAGLASYRVFANQR